MIIQPGTFHGIEGSEIILIQKKLNGLRGWGIEIGCCDGFSSMVILESSNLNLFSIDPLVPDSRETELIGNKNRLLLNMQPYGKRWHFIHDYSQNYNVCTYSYRSTR